MRHLRQTPNPRTFSLSHLLLKGETTWDSRAARKRTRCGHARLFSDAEPSIDLLLPLVALGYVIAPRTALAIACRILQGLETLARSEHVRARLAETIHAYRSQAILLTKACVRLA